jgi:hypothetical protein
MSNSAVTRFVTKSTPRKRVLVVEEQPPSTEGEEEQVKFYNPDAKDGHVFNFMHINNKTEELSSSHLRLMAKHYTAMIADAVDFTTLKKLKVEMPTMIEQMFRDGRRIIKVLNVPMCAYDLPFVACGTSVGVRRKYFRYSSYLLPHAAAVYEWVSSLGFIVSLEPVANGEDDPPFFVVATDETRLDDDTIVSIMYARYPYGADDDDD